MKLMAMELPCIVFLLWMSQGNTSGGPVRSRKPANMEPQSIKKVESNMSLYHALIILGFCCGTLAFTPHVKEGLRNKHLTIAAEYWRPFFTYDRRLYHNATILPETEVGGIMWDLVKYMQKARNFTVTLVKGKVEGQWGRCYAVGNCTGMLGMVNRGEVDFALGK